MAADALGVFLRQHRGEEHKERVVHTYVVISLSREEVQRVSARQRAYRHSRCRMTTDRVSFQNDSSIPSFHNESTIGSPKMVKEEDNHREFFKEVISIVNSSSLPPAPVTSETKLRLYGLYKRITVGKLHDTDDGNSSEPRPSKPSFFNLEAYHKYEAWGKCDSLSVTEAVMEYARIIARQDNDVGRQCGEMIKDFEQGV